MENGNVSNRRLTVCIALLLAMTLAMNVLSALIRHREAGLGCAPWPACYATIDRAAAPASAIDAATKALTPTSTFKRVHRVLATVLLVLVAAVIYLALDQPLHGMARFLPMLLIGVLLLLAAIGPATYRKTLPVIATVNLLGGMTLLALGYWFWIVARSPPGRFAPKLLAGWAFWILTVQIALGAWTSANFAGTACTGVWNCPGPDPVGGTTSSFAFWRELGLDHDGRVIMDNSQRIVQGAHRVGAAVCTMVVGALGLSLCRRGAIAAGTIVITLLALQVGLGIAGATHGLALSVVLAHNVVASLLLLAVLRAALLSGGARL